MASAISSRVTELAYRAQHASVMVPTTAFNALMRFLHTGGGGPRPSAEAIRTLGERYDALLTRDLANAQAGHYPRHLLFSLPMRDYARRLPSLLADLPASLRRRRVGTWRELPDDVDVDAFPPYYRRTFHWQTDGYLSLRSAELYDLEVEVLFGGAADVMRRQILPPLTTWLADRGGAKGQRVLDVACGTGRALRAIHAAAPEAKLFGLDLSPFYVQQARRQLADVPDLSLVADNAEAMPFKDDAFDAVTCVYLFHELPRPARRRVFREIARVVRPGGRVVIEDSAQLVESADIGFFLERFPDAFHEPYYADYLRDDLAEHLAEAGLEVRSVEKAFVAKVVVADKPG